MYLFFNNDLRPEGKFEQWLDRAGVQEHKAKICANSLYEWCQACPQLKKHSSSSHYESLVHTIINAPNVRPEQICEMAQKDQRKYEAIFACSLADELVTVLPGIGHTACENFAANMIYTVYLYAQHI